MSFLTYVFDLSTQSFFSNSMSKIEENSTAVQKNSERMKIILSIDGGGVRGIIPAMILAEIERRLDRPLSSVFDLMVGTSSGSLICCGLSMHNDGIPIYRASDIVQVFETEAPKIFQSRWWRRVGQWINSPLYPSKNIESVLDSYCGDRIFSDALTNVMVTSYDILHNMPMLFKSWKTDRNFIAFKHILRAATAVPTLFSPKPLTINNVDRVLVDGAVFTNNPAVCAYASGKYLFQSENLTLLSLSNGTEPLSLHYHEAMKLGKIAWVNPLLKLLFWGNHETVDYQLQTLLSKHFLRIKSDLIWSSGQVNDVSPENLENLKIDALRIIERNKAVIDRFCQLAT